MNVSKHRKVLSMSNVTPSTVKSNSLSSKKLHHSSTNTLISSLNSKIQYRRRCRCPLIKKPLDFYELLEMAKEIPDDEPADEKLDEEKQNEENSKNDETEKNPELREEGNDGIVWTLDPLQEKRCTCDCDKGLSFQQVLNKFQMLPEVNLQSSGVKNQKDSKVSPPICRPNRLPVCRSISRQRTKNWIKTNITNISSLNQPSTSCCCREQKTNLQKLLKGLQDEFFTLKTKYRRLDKESSNIDIEASPKSLRGFAEIEQELREKEKEINMVMSLYKEMVTLKNQVKKLKEQKQSTATSSTTMSKTETNLMKQFQTYVSLN